MEIEPLALPNALHQLLEEKARAAPDHVFLKVAGEGYSLGGIDARADSLAGCLARYGIGRGDRVLVAMPADFDYLALWFAISKIGAVEVPINPAYSGLLLSHLLRTADATLAVVSNDFRPTLIGAATALLDPDRIVTLDELRLRAEEVGSVSFASVQDIGPSEPAVVIFTSGTTGPSKGVVMSHRHQLSFGSFFREIAGLSEGDISYNFLPFFHIAAKFITIGTLLAGGSMVLRPTFSLSQFWPDVRAHGVTVTIAVGGLCHLLHGLPARPEDADNSLRLIYAVPIPWEFKDAFERRFGVRLVEGYGGTETNLPVFTRLDDHTPPGSCGRASPHFQVEVQRGDGYPCRPNEIGEICIRPRHPSTLLSGYLGQPEKSVEAMRDLWFHTGDLAHQDEAGFFFFRDRAKDAIRRRGENISTFEVERVLCTHPMIAEAAVVGVPSEISGEEVRAILVPHSGRRPTHVEILEFCVGAMPHFMVPRYIEFRDELPRTPTLKVRKEELRSVGVTEITWDCEAHGLRISRKGLQRHEIAKS